MQLVTCRLRCQARVLQLSAEQEAAEEAQAALQQRLDAASAEAAEKGAQLEQLMQAQARLADQLSAAEADNEVHLCRLPCQPCN